MCIALIEPTKGGAEQAMLRAHRWHGEPLRPVVLGSDFHCRSSFDDGPPETGASGRAR
jgi:hypothetical protein